MVHSVGMRLSGPLNRPSLHSTCLAVDHLTALEHDQPKTCDPWGKLSGYCAR